MLSNEVFALECLQRYAENGDIVDASNGQFAHCPQPRRYGDKGYYLTWEDHQHQGLLQSQDIGECCFFTSDVRKWLLESDVWPDNYFELWDIYQKYSSMLSKENAKKCIKLGVGLTDRTPEKMSEDGRKAGEACHAEKNEEGKSVNAVEGGKKTFEKGVGVFALTSEELAENGRKGGRKGGKVSSSQVWQSTIDGFQGRACSVALHNKANGWNTNARIQIS